MRRRERTNRTNGELFCISGIIFKSLMLEKDISSMKFRRMTGLRDTLLYEICSYKVKLVKREIDIICEVFGLDFEKIKANKEEEDQIEDHLLRKKEKRKEYEVGFKPDSKKIKINFEDSYLPGLLFFTSKHFLDLADITEKTGIDLYRLLEIQALNKAKAKEFQDIYMYLKDRYCFFNKNILLNLPKKEKECPIYESGEIALYASDLYCDSKDPEKFPPLYYWRRACLADGVQNVYKMPSWFPKYANERRNLHIKERDKKRSSVNNYFKVD